MREKTISVCMTTYHGQKYILEQLYSILNQSYAPDEVIICDDCSKDETVRLIEDFIHEYKLEKTWHLYCNKQNKGYPENAYYAMSMCRGDIVFLADQDDVWQKDKIEKMYQVFTNQESLLLLSGGWGIMDKEGTIVSKSHKATQKLYKISVSQIFYKYQWPGMSMCYENTFGKRVAEQFMYSGIPHDMALALSAAQQQSFMWMDICLQYHRNHEENAALEEHRIFRLLNKKRKLIEINRYLTMLDNIAKSAILIHAEDQKLVLRKQTILRERQQNLEQKKVLSIIRQYLQNRDIVRSVTMLCDCLICWQKGQE